MILTLIVLASCGEKKSTINLENHYHNDFESYAGWGGITGYYNLVAGNAHSGRHAYQTDSIVTYSLSYSMPIRELSEKPVMKIAVSVWVKCLSKPASGSCVVSIERGDQVIKYYSFDLKEKDALVNEWMEIQGTAAIPIALPKDAIVKIYFWNKSKSVILVDDFDFQVEN